VFVDRQRRGHEIRDPGFVDLKKHARGGSVRRSIRTRAQEVKRLKEEHPEAVEEFLTNRCPGAVPKRNGGRVRTKVQKACPHLGEEEERRRIFDDRSTNAGLGEDRFDSLCHPSRSGNPQMKRVEALALGV
jgi:hypothetical protein